MKSNPFVLAALAFGGTNGGSPPEARPAGVRGAWSPRRSFFSYHREPREPSVPDPEDAERIRKAEEKRKRRAAKRKGA